MSIETIIDFTQSTTPVERYRPAPEKILKGEPDQTVYNHYSSPCGQFAAGVWEGEVGQWTVNYTEHEYCEIVQGVSVLRDEEGNARTLRAGDRFVIPAGFKGTWEVLEPCRKIYAMFEQK
ncbi:cupin domain-containing protein [Pseudomonas capeferrum]|uniref:cupin domain-containing protein n=1 Tax=Pseudomonas capeferrum TaxID=1495066 RepID=UPI0015E41B24|nr:cupin domain-containing protein [Pseudomonas capeferrum]MBA1204053.1 cupin domain-containing protein [Pseudomonas capeferrum]